MLKLNEVQKILNANVLCCDNLLDTLEIKSVCGADLLSDVLAFTNERSLLLTGMTNLQVIRTVEISDLSGVVFVRGKIPREEVIRAAHEQRIPLLSTEYTMYEACGRLYCNGLPGCLRVERAASNG